MDKKCFNCDSFKTCKKETHAWFFIIIGFIATIAIRIVTLLMKINPIYGKSAWYVGIIGFTIFFIYKYQAFKSRGKLIENHQLLEKLDQNKPLSPSDSRVISEILCNIKSNKERINYLFIFIASAIALALAIIFDVLAMLR